MVKPACLVDFLGASSKPRAFAGVGIQRGQLHQPQVGGVSVPHSHRAVLSASQESGHTGSRQAGSGSVEHPCVTPRVAYMESFLENTRLTALEGSQSNTQMVS